MSESIRFDITVHTGCDRLQNRSLRAAAAVCLKNAVGGKASIFWPGDIVADGGNAASVSCAANDGGAVLSFEIDPAYAREGLKDELEAALNEMAAGFPENNADIIQQYCNSLQTLMKFVDTTYRGMPVYGFAFAVDKFGGLMVMTQASRSVVTVYNGRAELAKDEPQQPDMPFMPRV